MVTYLLIIVDVGAKVRQTIKVGVPLMQIFVSILQNLLFWLWHSIKKQSLPWYSKLCFIDEMDGYLLFFMILLGTSL
jgi:hypothetical protein